MSLENLGLITSFSSHGSRDPPRTDCSSCASVPAKLSDLILLHPPLTHFSMLLECSKFIPIPRSLFLAPGIMSPRASCSWLLLIRLPASVSPPLKRLLSDEACWMAFQSSPRISLLHFRQSTHHHQTLVGCLSHSTTC